MNKVCIIGVGPGAKDYLLPISKREIEEADTLIGARRLLALFGDLNKEKIYLKKNFEGLISYIKENMKNKRIAVLVSGDPGLYSFLGKLKGVLKKEEYIVIPGISALQLAFARIGEAWHDAKVISLHGRSHEDLAKEVKAHPNVFLFSDEEFGPEQIASYLLGEGIDNRRTIVLENLSYPNERIIDADLEGLKKMRGFGLCAMIIKKEKIK